MYSNQIKLLADLAKNIKNEPKNKEEAISFLQSAKILDSKENYSKNYPTLI